MKLNNYNYFIFTLFRIRTYSLFTDADLASYLKIDFKPAFFLILAVILDNGGLEKTDPQLENKRSHLKYS